MEKNNSYLKKGLRHITAGGQKESSWKPCPFSLRILNPSSVFKCGQHSGKNEMLAFENYNEP